MTLEAPPTVPQHVAIIMDGNGRWAKAQGKPRLFGHSQGAKTVKTIVTASREWGVRYLTLYAFSEQNWQRAPTEVTGLMKLLEEYLKSQMQKIVSNNIRLNMIGNLEKLPHSVQTLFREVAHASADNDGMQLTLALSYDGRAEIVAAAQSLAREVAAGRLTEAAISESVFQDHLQTQGMPDPDVVIRTSAENRLSNFMLFQAAYSEFVVVEKLWPDFSVEDYRAALEAYAGRERRYGREAASS